MSQLYKAVYGTASLANAAFGSSEEEEALQELGAYDDYLHYYEPVEPDAVLTVEPPSLMSIIGEPVPDSHEGWYTIDTSGYWSLSGGFPEGVSLTYSTGTTSLDCTACHLP